MAKQERYGLAQETETDLAIDEFRQTINNLPCLVDEMIRHNKNWNKITSSMDVVDYTEAAMKAYEFVIEPTSGGELYLNVYGLFQAMVVQQDAVKHIFECVGGTFPAYNEEPLRKIRDFRNDCVGHPTSREIGVEPRSTMFFSNAWRKDCFRLIRYFHEAGIKNSHEEIKPLELIDKQRTVVAENLRRATGLLKGMEKST